MSLRRFHRGLLGVWLGPGWGVGFVVVATSPLAWIGWQRSQQVIFYPTHPVTAERMLELAEIRPGEVVVDLGSGHGTLLLMAARRFGAVAVGVERDPLLVLLTRLRSWWHGLHGRVRVVRGDFGDADLSQADVVLLYLSSALNQALQPRLLNELKPTARVVSNFHGMAGWEPDGTRPSARPGESIFLYHIGHRQASGTGLAPKAGFPRQAG
jgi:SAM-dependent methyltransferase